MEFEKITPPAWKIIKDQIHTSDAVFLLLGPSAKSSIHTQNWIAFEVGLSSAFDKEVWVFEQDSSLVEFPVPYLTDCMIYNLEDSTHFDYVRSIIEGYAGLAALFPLGVDSRTKRGIPLGESVICAYDNCRSKFSLHTDISSFYCPSCRQLLNMK